MNLPKKLLVIIVLATIASLDAKRETSRPSQQQQQPVQKVPAAPAKSTPARRSAPTSQTRRAAQKAPAAPQEQEAPAYQTFHQLRSKIVNNKTPNAIVDQKTGSLQEKFIKDTIIQAKTADLGYDGIDVLLRTARDIHAPFTSDNITNMRIINNTNTQISKALGDYLSN